MKLKCNVTGHRLLHSIPSFLNIQIYEGPGSRETQQTLHFSEVHCYGSAHTESSSNSPDNHAFHSRPGVLVTPPRCYSMPGVVWYSNDRMVAGLGLLPGTAPNGAPPRLAHPLCCTLLFLGQQCYIGKSFSDDLSAFGVYGWV